VPWLRRLAWLTLAARAAPLLAAERFEIRFGEQLGLGDLRLVGARASRQVDFPWPMDWRPLAGAELRLRLERAPTLDGERSFLGISLNHGLLRTLRLEPGSNGVTDLVVPLAPEMIREENQLVIFAEQFSTAGAAEAAWTMVRSDSSLSIPFERTRVERSLADLPEPIVSRSSYEARHLTILLPVRPSRETAEATARVLASLTARVAPSPVILAFTPSLRNVSTPAVAVGTPTEQPALRELGDLGEGAAKAAPSTGIVALVPEAGPRAQPLLVVTGKEPAAVARRPSASSAWRGPRGADCCWCPQRPRRAPRRRGSGAVSFHRPMASRSTRRATRGPSWPSPPTCRGGCA